jgi:heme-degrading monooxygenase HmoA
MIAVIFEAIPAEGKSDEYLDTAANLRPVLEKIEGFLSIERYQSIASHGKVLSLSFWKDEDSVTAWRKTELHRQAQQAGRASIFTDYRLRVATVQRDYSMNERDQVPDDSKEIHDK